MEPLIVDQSLLKHHHALTEVHKPAWHVVMSATGFEYWLVMSGTNLVGGKCLLMPSGWQLAAKWFRKMALVP